MSQTSKVVTTIDGIDVMEITVFDVEGEPAESRYYVQGEKYPNLREAREAARKIAEG